MRGTFIALTAGLTLLMSTAAMAHDTTNSMSNDAMLQNTAATSGDKIVCKPITHEGMLVRTKQNCNTVDEWKRIREYTQQQLSDYQMKSMRFGR
ncbi:MAG TPA: hypothetical protein VFI93_01485 [Rhizomicrobium sp.]|jgi:hypothetical protein|nr:hypothetical protein [Rhizomicrobium sp.]